MENANHPEQHVIEEPRNDMMDTAVGFGIMFVSMLVVAGIFTAIELALK
jgi:hypothetical protein